MHWARRLTKQSIDRYWRETPLWHRVRGRRPERVSFDAAFPDVDKVGYVPARHVRTPQLCDLPLTAVSSHLAGPDYEIPADFVAAVSGGLFAASNSVVLSEDRMVVDESSTAARLEYFLKREFFLSPTTVSWTAAPLRSCFHNFYHWIIDCLPRLVALADSTWAQDGPIDLLYTGALAPYETFFLDRFPDGLFRLRQVDEHSLFRVATLLFTPLKTQRFAGFVPASYAEDIRALVVPDRPRNRRRRLLVSRGRAQYRRIRNEDRLLDALSTWGFDRVFLEDLTLDEQAELFYDAEAVVAPHGAGLTHLLYAERANVLEIFPNPSVTPHYYFLSQSRSHRYDFLCGEVGDLNPVAFDADVNAACRIVDSWNLCRS